ncbi:SF2_C_EcoAI-like domain containing protein [Acidimicrobiia bacterium]
MNIAYDPDLVTNVGYTLDLRVPNLNALDAIAHKLETAPAGAELIADLATGVGKTFIAGGLLDYLAESGVRNVVIVTPGSTIQRKTIDNLTPGHPKFLRGLRCNPLVITLDDLERGTVAAALDDESQFKVFVFTVQSLLRPDTKDARRAHRAHETLGQALYEYLQNADDLVVIADEHHVYYSGNAKKFSAAIDDLHPVALIGLTATPHEKSEANIIYRYPLAAAIADGYVKIPVLVARQDGMNDLRTQMADGLALLNAKAAAVEAYCKQTKKQYVQPILFVVAQTIDEATAIRDMLAGPGMLADDKQVLLVTSEEPDATLEKLDRLEDSDSPVRAVVSVSMLKEGWDVKNIYVIAAVRAMESQLLTEQILGRGLRLPFGERTGVPMLDTVEVLSHHAFADLLKDAKVLLEATLGDRANEATAITNPVAGLATPGVSATGKSILTPGVDQPTSVIIELPGQTPATADSNQGGLSDAPGDAVTAGHHTGMGFSTVDRRLEDAETTTKTLMTTLVPREPGGVRIPLFLPRVSTRWEREQFSLSQVNLVDVEGLGRQFANGEGSTLRRKALDATRTAEGDIELEIRDESDAVLASQTQMRFDTIESDLATRLLQSNGVAATVSEANAATAIARAFLEGAEVTTETPWRPEHGRLATARLVAWISEQQTSKPAREVREITQVKWPEPVERVEARPPADRQLINSSRDFVRGYPYSGWVRSVYSVNAFDAYSTEFRLGALLDSSPGVKAWVRIDQTVPLRITYLIGAIQREYEPDFIVIDDDGVHWIVEGKSDKEMTDPTVIAKTDAARAWVTTVNSSASVSQKWGYVLANESVIDAASNWAGIKAGGGSFTN